MSTTSLTKPHFFQPLTPGFEDKFFIPVSFFKYLKGQECHRLTLRSTCGKLWPIKISGRQFSDGWTQFVQDHHLHIGDFLLFRHEGDLVFDFVVFDTSTCEREYEYPPFIRIKEEESENPPFIPLKEEETGDQQVNVPIHISSGEKLEKKKKAKTGVEVKASDSVVEYPYPNCLIKLTPDSIKKSRLHVPRKFARENGLYGRSCSIILKDEDANCWRATLMYTSSDRKFVISAGWMAFHRDHKLKAGDLLMVELVKKGETPVLQMHKLQEHPGITWVASEAKASSSVTKKCFFVAKVTRATYSLSHLYIPTIFSRLHLHKKKYSKVILKDQEGRSWRAKLLHTFSKVQEQVLIKDGWKEFSCANKLKPGDSFVFEFIENGNYRPVFKMHGFKAFSGNKAGALPHFYVNMQISYDRNSQRIPRNFTERYNLATRECSAVNIKNEVGKSWVVSLRLDKTNEVYMTNGWVEFVQENGIQGADVFMLELVKAGTRPEMRYYALKQ